jgi:XTP/dITP diphosphohydrolase
LIRLYCASGNPGKLREFRMAAEGRPDIDIELLPGFQQIPECVEDGATFEENAVRKAQHYGAYTEGLLFADDSGIEVDALQGAPGVYSARFSGPQATDERNNRLLLEKLQDVGMRRARFVCVIALAERGRVRGIFRGAVEGEIAAQPKGANGFGYDPLFFYAPFGCTFGEVAAQRKFAVSHRGQALRAMLQFLGPG